MPSAKTPYASTTPTTPTTYAPTIPPLDGASLALALGLGLGLPLGVGLCVFLIYYVVRMPGQRSPALVQKKTNNTVELPSVSVVMEPEVLDPERVVNPLTLNSVRS